MRHFFALAESVTSLPSRMIASSRWGSADNAGRLPVRCGVEQSQHRVLSNTHCPDHIAYKYESGSYSYSEHRLTNGEIRPSTHPSLWDWTKCVNKPIFNLVRRLIDGTMSRRSRAATLGLHFSNQSGFVSNIQSDCSTSLNRG